MADQHVVLPLKRFLLVAQCPPDWRRFDLYLFRDDEVAFYVGQSHLAYDRVWQHIYDGYKARSVVGRFVLCNWPGSMRFTIELWSSQDDRFAGIGHDLDAAERLLIEQHAPCFNEALNRRPTSLPDRAQPQQTHPRSRTRRARRRAPGMARQLKKLLNAPSSGQI